jgi:hypothetical protein
MERKMQDVFIAATATGAIILLIGLVFQLKFVPSKKNIEEIKEVMWERHVGAKFPLLIASGTTGSSPSKKEANDLLSYLERVIDRQINKARGILPFNSIILALITFGRDWSMYQASDPICWHRLALGALCVAPFGLVISSFLCLWIFLVRWAEKNEYAQFDKEITSTFKILRKRSALIEWATVISALSLFIVAIVFTLMKLGY